MIVADTDVLIDALRGHGPWAERIALELEVGGLATTSVTAFELLSGARSPAALDAVGRVLSALTILGMDEKASASAAEVRRDLEGRGTPIGMADYLIAGICLTNSAILLTRNRSHFARINGLKLGRLDA